MGYYSKSEMDSVANQHTDKKKNKSVGSSIQIQPFKVTPNYSFKNKNKSVAGSSNGTNGSNLQINTQPFKVTPAYSFHNNNKSAESSNGTMLDFAPTLQINTQFSTQPFKETPVNSINNNNKCAGSSNGTKLDFGSNLTNIIPVDISKLTTPIKVVSKYPMSGISKWFCFYVFIFYYLLNIIYF